MFHFGMASWLLAALLARPDLAVLSLSSEDHASIARTKDRNGDYPEAIAEYSKAIAEAPEDGGLYLSRARARLHAHDRSGARQDVELAGGFSADPVDVLIEEAWILDDEGNASGAILSFSWAIDLDPDRLEAYIGRGHLLRDQGRRREGNADLLFVSGRKGDSWSTLYYRARANHRLSQTGGNVDREKDDQTDVGERGDSVTYARKALEDLNRAIQMEPDYSELYAYRAEARTNLGEWNGALQDCNRCIELAPTLAKPHFSKGRVFEVQGDYRSALQSYSRGLELDPEYPAAFYGRALAKGQLGDLQGALEDYSKALELDTHWPDAFVNRALVYEKLKRPSEAIADYTRAIEMNPSSIVAWCYRGYAKEHSGDVSGARQDYAKAVSLDAATGFHYEVRAMAKDGLEDRDGATADYKRALQCYSPGSHSYTTLKAVLLEREAPAQSPPSPPSPNPWVLLRPLLFLVVGGGLSMILNRRRKGPPASG
jgi:tetratricopeptide (TPR) repeat protein